jgi:hypothetical protein
VSTTGIQAEVAHARRPLRLPPVASRFRRLRLRGGELDGLGWAGEIEVGQRVACGTSWSPGKVYVVTAETTECSEGGVEYIATPAPF